MGWFSIDDIEFVPGGGAFQSLDVSLPPEGDADVEVERLLIEGARHAFEIQPLNGPEMVQSLGAIETFIG